MDCSIGEWKLGVLVDNRMTMNQKYVLVAKRENGILECFSKSREALLALCSALVRKPS